MDDLSSKLSAFLLENSSLKGEETWRNLYNQNV